MTIARKITAMTTAAAIAVTALVPMATAANAEGWRDGRRGDNHRYSQRFDGRKHYGKKKRHAKKHHRGNKHRQRYVVRRKKNNTGKYIAIGVGALLLGAVLADSARR